jgi:myotubularin-related protein 1/2
MMKEVLQIEVVEHFFAFSKGVSDMFKGGACILDGWKIYDPIKEYERLGFFPSHKWKPVMQSNYSLSPTYPSCFIIPSSVSSECLEAVCKYRSNRRVPVASWMHPVTKAVLSRGAQPSVGLTGQKSADDVKMLSAFLAAGGKRKDVYEIIDARSSIAAMGNKTRGKGTENVGNYPGASIVFMGVGNIHAVRSSCEMMDRLIQSSIKTDDDTFWKKLTDTGWHAHIRTIMAAALRVVQKVENEGISVFVHCSDGWDRTPQITSLAMLLMDPFYRTKLGLCVLVEKEVKRSLFYHFILCISSVVLYVRSGARLDISSQFGAVTLLVIKGVKRSPPYSFNSLIAFGK